MSPRSRSTSPECAPAARAGFTLIEVVAAMTILALMAGTIFAIVDGSARASVEIAELRQEDARAEACLARFREMFADLPAGATFELRLVESAPLMQELVVRGAPGAFVFGDEPAHEVPELVFALRRYADTAPAVSGPGGVAAPFSRRDRRLEAELDAAGSDADATAEPMFLGLSTPGFFREPPPDAPAGAVTRSPVKRREGNQFVRPDREGRFWIELVPDIAEARWAFYDPGNKSWVEKAGAGRPPLVELSLRPRGRKSPVRETFRPR
jgi:prepilin-type N-terminal cleavage/methylation domain-containing protein